MTEAIQAGDRVIWTEGGRSWTGIAVRVGVIHTLVAPDGGLPARKGDGGVTDWIRTNKLVSVRAGRAALVAESGDSTKEPIC